MQSAEERESQTNHDRDKYILDRERRIKRNIFLACLWLSFVAIGGVMFCVRHELKELIISTFLNP